MAGGLAHEACRGYSLVISYEATKRHSTSVNGVYISSYVESACNLLAGEGLRELFGYTRLKSGHFFFNVTRQPKSDPLHSSTTINNPSDSPLTVTKLSFCASETTGKKITRGPYHRLLFKTLGDNCCNVCVQKGTPALSIGRRPLRQKIRFTLRRKH